MIVAKRLANATLSFFLNLGLVFLKILVTGQPEEDQTELKRLMRISFGGCHYEYVGNH
jgi:hypothetical protein